SYQELLRQLGTSYEELRLARTADASARQALASRLGSHLEAARPDKLDQLLFVPSNPPQGMAQLTEAALETYFGVGDTSQDPVIANNEPLVSTWRRAHLRSSWRVDDNSGDAQNVPLIEPDVLHSGDFASPAGGNPAFDLWTQRVAWC